MNRAQSRPFLLSLALPAMLVAASAGCSALEDGSIADSPGQGKSQSETVLSAISHEEAVTPGEDGSPFAEIMRRPSGAPAYGHKKHTSVKSVMICLNTKVGTQVAFDRLKTVTTRVRDYFAASSQSRFALGDTTFVGCGGASGTLVLPEGKAGYYDGVLKDALELAHTQLGFNFAAYDTDRDGTLYGNEVIVTIMLPHASGNPAGAHRWVAANLGAVGVVDTIDCSFQGTADTSERDLIEKTGALAHEMMHQTFDADDMYHSPLFGAGWFSLMDQHWGAGHLDPFHKLKLGWLKPRAFPLGDATFALDRVDTTGEVAILYDPALGAREYFIVENRLEGLVLWRIVEDPSRLGNMPAWKEAYQGAIDAGLWGRYAIHRASDPITAKEVAGKSLVLTTGFDILPGPGGRQLVLRVVKESTGGRRVITMERERQGGGTFIDFRYEPKATMKFVGPFTAPAGAPIKVETRNIREPYDGADADLFVYRAPPSTSEPTCISSGPDADEVCLVPGGGQFWVGVYPYSGTPYVDLTLRF